MRLWTLWPRLELARPQSRQHPSSFWIFSQKLNTRINPLGLSPPEHHWYQCSRPGGSLIHGFNRQEQTILARFRSGHLKSMKFFKRSKSFEMCINCSPDSASPAYILECLGIPKQDLANDPFFVLDYLRLYDFIDRGWPMGECNNKNLYGTFPLTFLGVFLGIINSRIFPINSKR
ncbi:uncharacterized protein TNCV_1419611 [Trichonephila clavipes]|nr:uncharacterized protein TNCV_1419611 [Trichonephila clavipes]